MLDLAIVLLMNSALCFGFWNACYYEQITNLLKSDCAGGRCYEFNDEDIKGILWFIDKWSKGKWFYKPLCGCLPCMASFHSIYPYWIFMYACDEINLDALLYYPVYVLALSGINYLIDRK